MKIVFLTTDDPLYLPAFFSRVLQQCAAETQAIYVVPPLYKNQNALQAAWRYYRSFGTRVFCGLGLRVLQAKLKRQSIFSVCAGHHVPCLPVQDINAPEFLKHLRQDLPDVLVSVSCPQIFKRDLIDLPNQGILNIHGALLPHYRGVMPSFWMMANGEKQAGVSIYFVNEQIDAGDLCAQKLLDISPQESLNQFVRRSKQAAAELLVEVLERLRAGPIATSPLDLKAGSYYSWPDAGAYQRFRAAGRQFW